MRTAITYAIILAIFAPAAASACSCRNVPRTTEEHIEQNGVIFLGRAVGAHRVLVWDEGIELYQSTKFLVHEALKGADRDPAEDARHMYMSGIREATQPVAASRLTEGLITESLLIPTKGKITRRSATFRTRKAILKTCLGKNTSEPF